MSLPEYASLDRPEVLAVLFHPRQEPPGPPPEGVRSIPIPVGADKTIGSRWHMQTPDGPNLLFFHGNGEIAADYDDLGPLFTAMGINLTVVDYRGYGSSSGRPTVAAMMTDCHPILTFWDAWLQREAYTGPRILMGRSLGSASVLELAAAGPERIHGLIIESGFAYAAPLLRLLGIDPAAIGFDETRGFANLDKIKAYTGPTLIIHAEHDHIIPYADSQALMAASPAQQKKHVTIAGANHNDIFIRGMTTYLEAIKSFCRAGRPPA